MAHFTCSMCGATVADVTLHACGSVAGLARVVIYPPEPRPQTTEAGWTWTPARRWNAHELARVLLAGPDAPVLLDSIELLVDYTDKPMPESEPVADAVQAPTLRTYPIPTPPEQRRHVVTARVVQATTPDDDAMERDEPWPEGHELLPRMPKP